MNKIILFFITLLALIFISTNYSSFGYLSLNNDIGWTADYLILSNYTDSGKIISGGDLVIDNFQKFNQKYENIFSYFELPANTNGDLVSMKGVGRLFLKVPIFFLVGKEYFFSVWKVSSIIVILGLLLVTWKKQQKMYLAIKVLIGMTFISYFGFDLEFGCLFVSLLFLKIHFDKGDIKYLGLYFLMGLYSSVMRTEYFLFVTFVNIFLFGYFVYYKKIQYITPYAFISIFFIATLFLLNKKYYGDYFTFGYSLQSELNLAIISESKSYLVKYGRYLLPFGINLSESLDKIWYLFNSNIGIGILILLTFSKRNLEKFKYSKYNFYTILTIGVLLYGLFFYASNPYNYAPQNPIYSSYNRYLGIFLALPWIFFKIRDKFLPKSSYILLSVFMIINILHGQHFFDRIRDKMDQQKIFEQSQNYLAKNATILPIKVSFWGLSGFSILEPSGTNLDEYRRFKEGKIKSSKFLENIINFIYQEGVPIYIIGSKDDIQKQRILNFLLSKGLTIGHDEFYTEIKSD